jgi:hypothetical protein
VVFWTVVEQVQGDHFKTKYRKSRYKTAFSFTLKLDYFKKNNDKYIL